MRFIAPHISKEDIEKIWKMQVEVIYHQERNSRKIFSMYLAWSFIRNYRSFIHLDHYSCSRIQFRTLQLFD